MHGAPSAPFHQDEQPARVPIWREALAGLDWLALHASPVFYGVGVPRGDGSAVVLVPGFLATDFYLYEMYWWLRRIGYRPYLSRIGRNADCLDVLVDRLLATIERAYTETSGPVHLVGHSLGGVLARSAAVRRPERIASVVTLSAPFRGVRSHPVVMHFADVVRRRLQATPASGDRSQCFTSYCGCDAVASLRSTFPASVRQLAVYTRSDGIVDWRFCVNEDTACNVAVTASHIGLAFNPCAYRVIAEHLARASVAGA